jgi:hypothetical protein
MSVPFGERACRKCGCTQNRACYSIECGACWWVEWDLCSECPPDSAPAVTPPARFRCEEVGQ